MKKKSKLFKYFTLRNNYFQNGDTNLLEKITFLINEDIDGGSGGVGGMGAVVSAQPSFLPGAATGDNFSNGGGTIGSGDIGYVLNRNPFSKFPVPSMGQNHGARTGKKSRKKKVDLKALKKSFLDRPKKKGKVMNFNNFIKNDFTKVNKVEESLFTAMFISASIYFTLKHFWTELSNRSILNDLNKNIINSLNNYLDEVDTGKCFCDYGEDDTTYQLSFMKSNQPVLFFTLYKEKKEALIIWDYSQEYIIELKDEDYDKCVGIMNGIKNKYIKDEKI